MTMNRLEINQINEVTRQSYNLVAKKYHELFKDEMNQKEYDRNLLDDFSKCKTSIYFTHFKKQEIEKYFLVNGFKILFLERRIPYEGEIAVHRIYGIGEKI